MSASETKFYFLLQLAANCLKKKADELLTEKAGISTAQTAALTIINSDQPVNQKLIAEKLSQNESAVTTMVNRLMSSGFVKKERCKNDARAWLLSTTKEGRSALKAGKGSFAEINRLIDTSINKESLEEMALGLSKIIDSLREVK